MLATILLLTAVLIGMPVQTASAATQLTVTDYGVSGTGADSSSALNSLVSGGGKSLYFPAGTYRFAGISVPTGTTLTFASGAKILPGNCGGNFLNISGSNVTIKGGEFDGQNMIAIAIMGGSVSGLNVDGTSATNMTNGNVNLVGTSSSAIRNTSTTNSQYGIVVSGSSYITVDGTYAYGMGRDGILVYSSSHHITVSNNTVERWALLSQDGRSAIHTYGSSDLTVFGNTVKNGTYNAEGIRFRDSERFDCYNNTVTNTGGSGIAVVWLGDWQAVNGLVGGNGTIRNNTISSAHLRGISIPYTQLKPVRVLDNVITNTTSNFEPIDPADGIICYAAGSAIVGNKVTGSTGNGIRTGGANELVSDNTVSNVGTGGYGARSGILIQSSGNTVVRNTVSGAGSYGLYAMNAVNQSGNTISGASNGSLNLAGGTTGALNGDLTAPSASSDVATSAGARSASMLASSAAATSWEGRCFASLPGKSDMASPNFDSRF
jgi:parallel beta-helix repeat protein